VQRLGLATFISRAGLYLMLASPFFVGGPLLIQLQGPEPDWKDNIDNELWQELLRPFSAAKNLYLSEKVASRVARALQELVEGSTTEVLTTVLPTLKNPFSWEGWSSDLYRKGLDSSSLRGRPQVTLYPFLVGPACCTLPRKRGTSTS
jgi:hypothetical protein